MSAAQWWEDRSNLVLLTRFMVTDDHTADEVAYAVEKPWKHEDVWERVQLKVREDRTFAEIARNYRHEQAREAMDRRADRTYTVVEIVDLGPGDFTESTCPQCEGTKRQPDRDVSCARCAGYGRVFKRAAS